MADKELAPGVTREDVSWALRTASDRVDEALAVVAQRVGFRDELLHRARDLGLTVRDLATMSGLSAQRVHQVTSKSMGGRRAGGGRRGRAPKRPASTLQDLLQ